MKLSISLPDADVAALDEYMRSSGLPSRSAVLQRALRLLAQRDLEADYEAAWQEWDDSGDRALWEQAGGDGLAAR